MYAHTGDFQNSVMHIYVMPDVLIVNQIGWKLVYYECKVTVEISIFLCLH